MGRRTRIERSTPFPLTVPPAHKTGFGVEVRLICPGKTSIFISCFHISRTICQYGYTPIIVCIFQCLCHRFIFEVARNIAQRILVITGTGHHKRNQPLRTDNAGRVVFGSAETGLVGFANIEIAIALHVCIGDDRGSMIANHRSRVVGSTIPFRENASLTLFLQQRTDIAFVGMRVYDGEQRMQRTECVPNRKSGVNRVFLIGGMHFQVHPQITSVYIGKQVRTQECMIHGGIENGKLVGVFRFHVYL